MSGAQSSAAPAATSRNATKRLLKEIDSWREEQKEEKGIERLGPAGEEDLFVWEAVVNGKGVGGGYDCEYRLSLSLSTYIFPASRFFLFSDPLFLLF
jgi:ubiquitin-protein ligase